MLWYNDTELLKLSGLAYVPPFSKHCSFHMYYETVSLRKNPKFYNSLAVCSSISTSGDLFVYIFCTYHAPIKLPALIGRGGWTVTL
jgi:hypothetical protein